MYLHSFEQMKRDAAKKIDEAIGTVLGVDVTASDASCGDENGAARKPRTERTSLNRWNLSPTSQVSQARNRICPPGQQERVGREIYAYCQR